MAVSARNILRKLEDSVAYAFGEVPQVSQKRFPIVTVKNYYVGMLEGPLWIECTCLAAA